MDTRVLFVDTPELLHWYVPHFREIPWIIWVPLNRIKPPQNIAENENTETKPGIATPFLFHWHPSISPWPSICISLEWPQGRRAYILIVLKTFAVDIWRRYVLIERWPICMLSSSHRRIITNWVVSVLISLNIYVFRVFRSVCRYLSVS